MMLGRHYHVAPSCLLRQLNQTAGTHSPQVGWMADGFPLYGPLGPTGEAMRRCQVRDANLASKFRIKIWTLSDQRGICFVWETLFLF